MRHRWRPWICALLISGLGGVLFVQGCLLNAENEISLLLAPEANLDYVHQSWLVNTFGPGVLKFW